MKRKISALLLCLTIGFTAFFSGLVMQKNDLTAYASTEVLDPMARQDAIRQQLNVQIGSPVSGYKFALLDVPSPAKSALTAQGLSVTDISALQIRYSIPQPISAYNCLIIGDGTSTLHKDAVTNVKAFVKAGGSVILIGDSTQKIGAEQLDLDIGYQYEKYSINEISNLARVSPRSIESLSNTEINLTGATGYAALAYVRQIGADAFTLMESYDGNGVYKGPAVAVLADYAVNNGAQMGIFGITGGGYYTSTQFYTLLGQMAYRFASKYYYRLAVGINDYRKNQTYTYEITEPRRSGFVTMKNGKFYKPDGSELFLIGVNYTAPVAGGSGYGGGLSVNIDAIEGDFQKAAATGINFFRIWSVTPNNDVAIKAVINASRKYGIYLLFQLNTPMYYTDSTEYAAYLTQMTNWFKNEETVLGYDLANEPFITNIGGMSYDGVRNSALDYDSLNNFPFTDGDREWITAAAAGDYWPNLPSYLTDVVDRERLWGLKVGFDKSTKDIFWQEDRNYTAMPGYWHGRLWTDVEDYEDAFTVNEESFNQWISFAQGTLKAHDSNHFVTVGYNSINGFLAANEQLDFINHHIYQPAHNLEDYRMNITAFDRLYTRYLDKPITSGEFGVSLGAKLPSGEYIDEQVAVGFDMINYLYPFRQGYSGATIWNLNEFSIIDMKHRMPWLYNSSQADQIMQSRIGLFTYDNGYYGRKKQIANALSFFANFAGENVPGRNCILEIKTAESQNGAGYLFRGPNAVFVGNKSYTGENFSFNHSKFTNVFYYKNAGGINLMSTSDCVVSVKTANNTVDGNKISAVRSGDYLNISLIAGETVIIH